MGIVSKFGKRNIEKAPLVSPDDLDVNFSVRTVINFFKGYHGALLTPREVKKGYYINNGKLERLNNKKGQNNYYMLKSDLVKELKQTILNKLNRESISNCSLGKPIIDDDTSDMLDYYYEEGFITENDLKKLITSFINKEIMKLIYSPLITGRTPGVIQNYHNINLDIPYNYRKILIFGIVNGLINKRTLDRIDYLLKDSGDNMEDLISKFNCKNMSSIDFLKNLKVQYY